MVYAWYMHGICMVYAWCMHMHMRGMCMVCALVEVSQLETGKVRVRVGSTVRARSRAWARAKG
jgi:hypothetical protein